MPRKSQRIRKEPVDVLADDRIDLIGLVAELSRELVDDVKTELKLAMDNADTKRVSGKLFDGVLSGGSSREVSVQQVVELYDRGKLKKKQLLSMLSVKCSPAEKVLGKEKVDAISRRVKTSQKLKPARKSGVELSLDEVMDHLARVVAGKKTKKAA